MFDIYGYKWWVNFQFNSRIQSFLNNLHEFEINFFPEHYVILENISRMVHLILAKYPNL